MTKVLIVGKTHMKDAVCIGGINLETKRGIRLLSQGDLNQPLDTQFNIGQI